MEIEIRFFDEFRYHFNRIKRWIIYRSLKKEILRKRKELENAILEFPDEVRTTLDIVKLQAKKKSSEVLYAPVSGEFYITNGDKFIILKNHSINIINGLYNYYIDIPYEAREYLDKYLKRIVERKRSMIKRQIESKITRSLNDILEHVKEK
jgi:hypothetical protein